MRREMNEHRLVPFPVDFWEAANAAEWTPGQRFVAAFLLSCPERFGVGREGLFPMTVDTICRLQGGWSRDRVERALVGLEDSGWLVRENGWFLIPSVMEYDQPLPGTLSRSAAKRLRVAPKHSQIWRAFLSLAGLLASHLHQAILKDQSERPPNGAPRRTPPRTPARSPESNGGGPGRPVTEESSGGTGGVLRLMGTPGGTRNSTSPDVRCDEGSAA